MKKKQQHKTDSPSVIGLRLNRRWMKRYEKQTTCPECGESVRVNDWSKPEEIGTHFREGQNITPCAGSGKIL